MSDEQHTELSQQSWFWRIGNSLSAVLFVVLFFILSFPLLFLNEGCSVKTARSLSEEGKAVRKKA